MRRLDWPHHNYGWAPDLAQSRGTSGAPVPALHGANAQLPQICVARSASGLHSEQEVSSKAWKPTSEALRGLCGSVLQLCPCIEPFCAPAQPTASTSLHAT